MYPLYDFHERNEIFCEVSMYSAFIVTADRCLNSFLSIAIMSHFRVFSLALTVTEGTQLFCFIQINRNSKVEAWGSSFFSHLPLISIEYINNPEIIIQWAHR